MIRMYPGEYFAELPFNRSQLQPFPETPLSEQIARALEEGISPTTLLPHVYDDEDDESFDPDADIRTDRFLAAEDYMYNEIARANSIESAGDSSPAPSEPTPPASPEA